MGASDILPSLFSLKELSAIVKLKCENSFVVRPEDEDWAFSYDILNDTSRSFSRVIQELDPILRDPICIFYLVLRALDSIEDDMDCPFEFKTEFLNTFHEKLSTKDYVCTEYGEKPAERVLLSHFDQVLKCFHELSADSQRVIADITRQMGAGMARYLTESPSSMADWDQYCHYVAGLVGIGLNELFVVSGLEGDELLQHTEDANILGLFLQKVNIIRDFREDALEGRLFWPSDVWKHYTAGEKPSVLLEPTNLPQARGCLNTLVANALEHVPTVLSYISLLKNPTVFRFVAIPQVMAIATLAEVVDNPAVFRGVVKIRKGAAAHIMVNAGSLAFVVREFQAYLRTIVARLAAKPEPERVAVTDVSRTGLTVIKSTYALPCECAVLSPTVWLGLGVAAAYAAYHYAPPSFTSSFKQFLQ
eukprot:GCRY01000593.1.p2 GENE.GCRY01000593.1~~GCRY01000593.1.p2  ORF type:complete len:419 (+),score=122.92 GCRY01000593.1:76-1332(+)